MASLNECHMSVHLTEVGEISIRMHGSEEDAETGENPKIVICMAPDDANKLITMMLMCLGRLEMMRSKGPTPTA
jgi:hypothetical protein